MRKLVYILIVSLLAPLLFASEKGDIQIFCQPKVKVFLNGKFKGKSREKLNGYILKNLKYGTYKIELERENSKEFIEIDLMDTLQTYISRDFTRLEDRSTLAGIIQKESPELVDAIDVTGRINADSNEIFPEEDEFVPVDIMPEMIHRETPEYPSQAKMRGDDGVVWVKALVDKEGNVRNAKIGKSSGSAYLDDAALRVAYKNKFKPGIQNGKPVNVWLSYKVTFALDR